MTAATMLDQAAAFGEQLRSAAPLARGLLRGRGPFRSVLLAGLGGSAAGARLAVAMLDHDLTVPVVVSSGRALPGWVGPDTLVVATSYSGETVETVDLSRAALERGATIAAVTAGGTLAELTAESGGAVVLVEGGYQPRGALGLLLAPLLVLLHEAGTCSDPLPLILAGADAADEVMRRCGPATDGGAAREAAAALVGREVVLYGSGVRAAVAVRLKNQINENAKAAAFAGALPEIAHNEVLGWIGTARTGAANAAVFLRDPDEDPEEAVLADAVVEQIGPDTPVVLSWRGEGGDALTRAFSLLAFGDLVSCHLGLLQGVDLLDIERLHLLKQRLTAARG